MKGNHLLWIWFKLSVISIQTPKKLTKNMSSNSNQPIKILKRQPNANTTGDGNSRQVSLSYHLLLLWYILESCLSIRVATQKPLKTFEEREAAYAEARRRILGSSPPPHSPVEEMTKSPPIPATTRTNSTAPTPVVPNITVPAMVPQQRLIAPPNIPYMGQNLIDFNRFESTFDFFKKFFNFRI